MTTISSILEAFTYVLNTNRYAKVSNRRQLIVLEASFTSYTSKHHNVSNYRHLIHLGDVHLHAITANKLRSAIATIS